MSTREDPARKVLLSVADGPESIQIYTSEDEAIVDWGHDIPALYVSATLNGAYVKLGPFMLRAIREGVESALKPTAAKQDGPNWTCPDCGFSAIQTRRTVQNHQFNCSRYRQEGGES